MTGLGRLASFIVGFIKSHTSQIWKNGKLKKIFICISDFPKERIVFKDINPIYKEVKNEMDACYS